MTLSTGVVSGGCGVGGLAELRAGLVTINSWGPDSNAPFGGYKQSGNGREYGKYGLRDFMEVKTVVGS